MPPDDDENGARVVVLGPDQIVAPSPRGPGDLYVAVTRATPRLGVVYSASLPKCLDSLA
ncbi:hypothetical protein GCM10022223_30550 [Kineosporia mesophila]|uniref:UvrD-like helicase C-terminal domain-containing protein n=1 Tax=Kineosporia mesophila TaxID=566012 RepID=A0ABP6ZL76_9ACTN|nr:hypothetical protein [Kineosporia mesophila]MCD5349528.1 hypothetical protein [Kineosporia mesophila]